MFTFFNLQFRKKYRETTMANNIHVFDGMPHLLVWKHLFHSKHRRRYNMDAIWVASKWKFIFYKPTFFFQKWLN